MMGCCGKCKYNKLEKEEGKPTFWACNNPESEMYGVYTQYDDYCDEYQGKEDDI